MTRPHNPHRNSWRRELGEKHHRCGVPGCGAIGKTARAKQIHADVHEPRPLDTHGLIEEES